MQFAKVSRSKYRTYIPSEFLLNILQPLKSLKPMLPSIDQKTLFSMLSNAGIGIWKWNILTGEVAWDQTNLSLHDFPPEKFTGTAESWERTLHPADKASIMASVEDALSGKAEFSRAIRIITLKGVHKVLGARGEVVRDESGKPIAMWGINWDLSSKFEIESLKSKIEETAAGAPGLVYQFLMTPNGETSMPFLVPSGLKMFELTEEDYRNDNNLLIKMVHPDDIGGLAAAIQKSAHEQSTFDWTGRIYSKNGNILWIHASSNPKRLPDGSTTWNGVMMDVSREKDLEFTLLRERAAATETARLASLGEMAGGIAHEINNPLAILDGKLQQLIRQVESGTPNPKKLKEDFEKMRGTVARIGNVVRGLRSISRSGKGDPFEMCKLERIISDTMGLCHERFRVNGVDFSCDVVPDVTINCRPTQITQVLLNLLNNSFDAVQELPEKWIKIELRPLDGRISIAVVDAGQGVPESILGKIMTPFFTTKPVGKGTGLGLSIAKKLIEENGGTLEIARDRKNTTFEIHLPIADFKNSQDF